MKPANISRDDARARSKVVNLTSYEVTVDLTGTALDGSPLAEPDETFVSTSTIRFTSTGEPTYVDLIADAVLDATLDDEDLDTGAFGDSRFYVAPSEGEHVLSITALCRYSHTGEGLHRFVDPADQAVYLYSQFEPADARRMYACFEQPDLKATFQLTTISPAGWVVASNSIAPEPEILANGAQCHRFAPTVRISTYLTVLVAGDYVVHEGTISSIKGTIPANILTRRSMVDFLDADRITQTTQRGFDVYEKAFDHEYAFDKYDQVFVPEFNARAMENAGCVTLRDEYLFRSRVTADRYDGRDNTILHELAHMWFGDLVTMTWWDDLWLNESFAEWASHWCQQQITAQYGGTDPWVSFANARKGWAYVQDQLPTTHPVAADMVDLEAVEQNFDGITYAKGASVLKQLVAFVGEEPFLQGVRKYFADHAFGNTTLTDLLTPLAEASGRDLSNFSGQWLEQAGVNTMTPDVEVDDDDRFTRFDVVQTATEDHPTLRTHRMAIGLYDLVDDAVVCRQSLEVDIHDDRTPIAVLVGQQRPDLILLNDRDLTYTKVRLDDRSLDTLLKHVQQVADPLARALCWSAAWEMTRDAVLAGVDFIQMVLQGVGHESDLTAVNSLRLRAATSALTYQPREARHDLRVHLSGSFASLLLEAEPGSDHQIAFANSVAQTSDSEAGSDVLKAWLSGDEVPLGLEVDADLRWTIITALARQGRLTDADIDAELERDPTIAGSQFAAGARAAFNDAEHKAAAWELATADPSVPNGTHHAICYAFGNYGQEDLLEPYVDKYFDLVHAISAKTGDWATRGYAASQAALLGLFPIQLVSEDLIARLDAVLGEPDLAAGVRRVLLEQRDQAARALRCQELSASRA